MLRLIIRSALGRAGVAALDWMAAHPLPITAALLVWLLAVAGGQLQLYHIKRKTAAMVLEMARDLAARKPHITASALYECVYPAWSRAVPSWAWFIPHRLDLWPVRATAGAAQQKMGFSPAWVQQALDAQGIRLDAEEGEETLGEIEGPEPWLVEELIIVPMRAQSAAEAIEELAARLQAGGYVRDSWLRAALERERTFATGLPTQGVGVAIPHADVEHVLKQGIAVGVLEEPVEFGEMGNPDATVAVRIVCALAVHKSDLMVKLLQRLVEVFQDEQLLQRMAAVQSAGEMVELLRGRIAL